MTPTLIVLALVALGVAIVVWATRRKPSSTPVGPAEADTAWNDPLTPGEPARPIQTRTDAAPPPQEPRP
ncbi:MAG: hypothetical protein ACXW3O_04875 [Brevundimonas sp.]